MERIAAIEEVPDDSTFLFRVSDADRAGADPEVPDDSATDGPDGGNEREAILLRTDDGAVAWLNYCPHLTHIKLDKGSGASMRDDEIVCRNHGAMFEVDSGRCTFGPCEGAYLDAVSVTVEDGAVYLVDPDYDLVGTGPVESDPLDLSSTSNVEF